jgi:hypothetical protein
MMLHPALFEANEAVPAARRARRQSAPKGRHNRLPMDAYITKYSRRPELRCLRADQHIPIPTALAAVWHSRNYCRFRLTYHGYLPDQRSVIELA